jgi:hypothetical protein
VKKATHLPIPRRSCRDCSSRANCQRRTRQHFCIRSRGPRGYSRIPIRQRPLRRLRFVPHVSRYRCSHQRMQWQATTHMMTMRRHVRFWCARWEWRCVARNWGRYLYYRCRDGRTCLQSRSPAEASSGSRTPARRDHHVLINISE